MTEHVYIDGGRVVRFPSEAEYQAWRATKKRQGALVDLQKRRNASKAEAAGKVRKLARTEQDLIAQYVNDEISILELEEGLNTLYGLGRHRLDK